MTHFWTDPTYWVKVTIDWERQKFARTFLTGPNSSCTTSRHFWKYFLEKIKSENLCVRTCEQCVCAYVCVWCVCVCARARVCLYVYDIVMHFYENALMILKCIQSYMSRQAFIYFNTCQILHPYRHLLKFLWDETWVIFHLVAIIKESSSSNPNIMVCIFNRLTALWLT